MKKIYFLISIFFFIFSVSAQEHLEKAALLQAEQMAISFNNRDYGKIVDYLAPGYYGNDPANKEKFAGMWKAILSKDSTKINIIKILKFGIFKDQQQALFETSVRNKTGCVFGISYDNGEKWYFTQCSPSQVNFNSVLNTLPSLDPSFASLVDPKFMKRIHYETGKTIAPFNFIDINGIDFSSGTLKGKIIVLNFWGIGCGPCILEIPELNGLVEKMKGKPVAFIAPAIYSSKDMLLNNFLPKHPFSYNIVTINNDDYNITSFPTHIIIDQNLKVIEKITGYNKENIPKLEQTILDLLKKSEKL